MAAQQRTPPNQVEEIRRRQRQAALERESFKAGRELLRQKGVPFDPDALLDTQWREKLAPAFALMPELSTVRQEGKRLQGAQLADTLLLSEKVELTGDTLILARRLIFEGREVEIKGHFSIHVFPINEIALLGDTFPNAASKLGQRFELIKASGTAGLKGFTGKLEPIRGGRITVNTSGAGRKEWLEQQRQRQAAGGLKFLKTGGLAPPQVTQDQSGWRGADGAFLGQGSNGAPGAHATNGANGSCGSFSSFNGGIGGGGGTGGPGGTGPVGGDAMGGGNGNPISFSIPDGDTRSYTFVIQGGDGGLGGQGGTGGIGGDGARGGRGGDGATCACDQGGVGLGGSGGPGGNGGQGGNGGVGGKGGKAGNGGSVSVSVPAGFNKNLIQTDLRPGAPGRGGDPGFGGPGGVAGQGGEGGSGGVPILCTTAPLTGNGNAGNNGLPGGTGGGGTQGPNGEPGTDGSASITERSGSSSTPPPGSENPEYDPGTGTSGVGGGPWSPIMAGELHTLSSLGIRSLALDYGESRRRDRHGNEFRYRAKVWGANGADLGRWAFDVFLIPQP